MLSETLEELLQNFKTTNFEFYPTLVFLDGVTDPRNLGAIIRTADSVKVGAIVAPLNHSAPLNDLAINTACGATEFIPYIRVSNICRAIETVQNIGYQVIGMDTDGNKDVFSTDLKQSNTFIFGDEGVGLKKITKEFCDQIVKLPMYGRVESLNVSVACAISLYEDYRQKK